MITFEKAIKNVKETFPNLRINKGFEFRGKYVFELYSGIYAGKDVAGSSETKVYVLPDGKVVSIDSNEIFEHIEEYAKAKEKSITVDG